MILIRKPSDRAILSFLESQSGFDYTYKAVGATRATPPAGFVVDHTHVVVGRGGPAFLAARDALRHWEQFQLGWLRACPADVPIEPGRMIAVLAHVLGVWSLNACRIIYVIDEPGPPRRFGFAYGTTPGHTASGEERFLIEHNPETDEVTYDVLAFSCPRDRLARLGYRYVRYKQLGFGKASALLVQLAIARRLAKA